MQTSVDVVNKDRGAAADEVLEAVHAVMHLYRLQQVQAVRQADLPLTRMEGRALAFFGRRPGATQSELVAHAGRDKGQVARLIQSLRQAGLLEALPDAEDRRSLRLHLTPAGRAAEQALRRHGRRLAEQAVQGFSEAERQQLLALLGRLHANLAGGAG